MFRKTIIGSSLLFLSYCPVNIYAQSVTIIGNGEDARACSFTAESAAGLNFTSIEDLKDCDRALEYGTLSRRDKAATYVNRGIILVALERYQDAFSDYHRAMDLMPELPESYIGRGNIYFLAGKPEQAIEDYNKALKLNISRDYIAYLNLGIVYENLKDYKLAEENYRHALELFPDWGLAKNKLERLLNKQNTNS